MYEQLNLLSLAFFTTGYFSIGMRGSRKVCQKEAIYGFFLNIFQYYNEKKITDFYIKLFKTKDIQLSTLLLLCQSIWLHNINSFLILIARYPLIRETAYIFDKFAKNWTGS